MKAVVKKVAKRVLSQAEVNAFILWICSFFLKDSVKRMARFLENEVRNKNPETGNGVILMDFFAVEETLIAYAYFANSLAREKKSRLATYAYRHNILPYWGQAIYRAFGCSKIERILLSEQEKAQHAEAMKTVRATVKTKEDLLNFTFHGLDIGIDIYESILRDFNLPTVDMSDARTWQDISAGLELCLYWESYFKQNNVTGVILSHDTYMWMNVLAKVAYKHKVPVYLPSSRFAVKIGRSFHTYEFLRNYKKWFSSLSPEEQTEGRNWGEAQLTARLSGRATTELYYSKKSAYSSEDNEFHLKQSDKVKVLIASHCFYDNPHAFARMGFVDFLDWLDFLGKKSLETDYDWYIKVHPDPLPGTIEIIQKFLERFPHIVMVPYDVSHQQLIREGINWVVTCFGTIGEEYPVLGAGVVNCAYNPRIAYDFNIHCSTREELGQCLGKLKEKSSAPNLAEVYEFVFCHHRLRYCDDLVFSSYQSFLQYLMSANGQVDVFAYYLSQIDSKQIAKTKKTFDNYISSNAIYLTEKGPTNIFVESE